MVHVVHGWLVGFGFEVVDELFGGDVTFAGSIDLVEHFAEGSNILVLDVWIHENVI